MLVILLSVFCINSGTYAQDFNYPGGNPEYTSTQQFQVVDGVSYNNSGDPFINHSMECLAANGSTNHAIITYNISSPLTLLDQSSFSGNSCDHAWESSVNVKQAPLSAKEPIIDSCAIYADWKNVHVRPSDGVSTYKKQYDTLRLYVEHCAQFDEDSYTAFTELDADVQEYAPTDTARYERYRDWLVSVLYIKTSNPFFFCRCLQSIAITYTWGKLALPNAWFAIMKFELGQPNCADSAMQAYYDMQTQSRHSDWLAGDTTKLEDTTLPSLDALGLGFLLKKTVNSPAPISPIFLASFTTSPNPYIQETTLEFTLNRIAYIQVAVYNELGVMVWGDVRGTSLEAGKYSIHLDGKNLPGGTFYARISTGFGEVKTLKLVHE